MSREPTVSTIIPFYNTPPQFMREAIESVLAQTYHDWELLLIDDGSTAEGTDLARQYAQQYPGRIRYLEHEGHGNRGASAARNLGISHARGDYVALLDADDIWFPHKLEQQVAILESHPEAAMLYGNTEYWYSWTGRSEDRSRDFVPSLGARSNALIDPPKLVPLFLRGDAAVPCTCSIVVRRDVLDVLVGFEDIFPNMYDDQVFYSKVCLAAPVFVANTCWDRYRQHPESTCSIAERTGQTRAARLIYLHWLEEYLSARQIQDVGVWNALCEELRIYDHANGGSRLALGHWVRKRVRKLLRRIQKY